MKTPILVMTRNENEYLEQCIHSIIDTVTVNYHIYIIDNASDNKEHLAILKKLDKLDNVTVIRNTKNEWVLGLNSHLEMIKDRHDSKYFYLTDGDIDFSKCKAKPCWLSYSINLMDNNCALGKLGLSLSWDYLEENPELKNILLQEKSLYTDKKINDLYVSFVDTTATLFRWDWSIEGNSKFYPDHMRYLRPDLYSCRTPKNITVEHLGWKKYNKNLLPQSDIDNKIKCFVKVGGYVKDETLEQASKKIKYLYKYTHKTVLNMWILRRYFYLLKFVLVKGRRHFQGQG
ncbi:glycosyltransferase family A protein [Photobacterium andalusiense]|uniref:Glycosyl transferase family 2 n=1 Tax=Photobacterium andalusiense TaxID=2204296 RepID=A0A1Y6MJ65_9GAMM|nr:glycosyltransferase family A protein [Photobacterium andalusiense]SMY35949.1 Glycosyl transferase family 2 [Photobacterium andalusiense]